MKADAEAFGLIAQMVSWGHQVELYQFGSDYEITVLRRKVSGDHSHYQADTLIEAVKKAYKAEAKIESKRLTIKETI
jgi:hypothetical protein